MFSEDDIQVVASAMQSFDENVKNKTWRDLAIVAISAMGQNFAQPVPPALDFDALVVKLHENFQPETFGDSRVLDRICSIILGDEGYAKWLLTRQHQQHD